jgi:hypothetical protein
MQTPLQWQNQIIANAMPARKNLQILVHQSKSAGFALIHTLTNF